MKLLFSIFGFLFCGLGALGVLLPVLPTTPFLLLASACFLRSSPRLHRWFVSTVLYTKYFKDFAEHRTMTIRAKLLILLPVTALLTVAFLMLDSLSGRIIIACAVLGKYYYFLFRIKTTSAAGKAQV